VLENELAVECAGAPAVLTMRLVIPAGTESDRLASLTAYPASSSEEEETEVLSPDVLELVGSQLLRSSHRKTLSALAVPFPSPISRADNTSDFLRDGGVLRQLCRTAAHAAVRLKVIRGLDAISAFNPDLHLRCVNTALPTISAVHVYIPKRMSSTVLIRDTLIEVPPTDSLRSRTLIFAPDRFLEHVLSELQASVLDSVEKEAVALGCTAERLPPSTLTLTRLHKDRGWTSYSDDRTPIIPSITVSSVFRPQPSPLQFQVVVSDGSANTPPRELDLASIPGLKLYEKIRYFITDSSLEITG